MTEIFVIRNQLGHYWGKRKAWVDGAEAGLVMFTKHRDEAINTLVELGSSDYELRGEIIATELSARGKPLVEPSEVPVPIEPEPEPIEPVAAAEPCESNAPAA